LSETNTIGYYSRTWNAVIVREISFLPDRCKFKRWGTGNAFYDKAF